MHLNCDMGESFGQYKIGEDEAIMPWITSCNIACGMHAGDPTHIWRTLECAKKYKVKVGAHPGYPDLQGFGRRPLQMSDEDLNANIIYQISALMGMARSLDLEVHYVKPHGALYNQMAKSQALALVVIAAIKKIDRSLALMGLAGSNLETWADEVGISFIPEGFADRRYEKDGTLRPRSRTDAVIVDENEAIAQVSAMQGGKVPVGNGEFLSRHIESVCIHGDNPNVVAMVKAIHSLIQN